MDFDVLVAGEINPDLILSSPNLEPRFGQQETLVDEMGLVIGSSSAIFACGVARLGLKVGIIGIVGEDHFGHFMLEALSGRNVDISAVHISKAWATGISVILSRGEDKAILTYPGAMSALTANDINGSLLSRTRHLHVASYFLQTNLQPGLPEVFRRCKELNVSTSLDTNWDPAEHWAGLDDLLPLTDLFFPNKEEIRAITKQTEIEKALDDLKNKASTVALKLGGDGAIAQQNNLRVKSTTFPVEIVDTVGAGDSFDAGFVYGYLNGWELDQCLKLAVICGTLSTIKQGGTAAQLSLGEALAFLDKPSIHSYQVENG